MEERDHIDKALAFIEQTQKLGDQLKKAEEQQKFMLGRMIDLKVTNQTDSKEYAELSARSKGLQDMIDKWRPIYLERTELLKDIKRKK
ncbi:MAG: hypothetical protein E7104_03140 [Prevotella sp.]|nr:hypothetical protein [Prevotella sp.]